MKLITITIIIISFLTLSVISYDKCPYDILETGELTGFLFKYFIVLLHNYHRLQLLAGFVQDQPKSKHFRKIRWDHALATEAQKISNTCKFEHVKVDVAHYDSVGQNIYISCTDDDDDSTFSWTDAIEFWYNEKQNYTYPGNATEQTGHYTQLIWNTTKSVGCGCTFYEKRGEEEAKFCKLYVCNYGPGGNIIGVAPYEADEEE